jgi:hypothetical protein
LKKLSSSHFVASLIHTISDLVRRSVLKTNQARAKPGLGKCEQIVRHAALEQTTTN